MLENRFAITAEGLTEISRRLIRYTHRFVSATVAVPLFIALLAVLIAAVVPAVSPLLTGILAVVLILYFLRTISKVPARMAAQIYQRMRQNRQEPEEHTRLTETGIAILDGEDSREYAYPSIRLVFSTEHYLVAMNQENRAVYWKKDAFLDSSEQALLQTLRDRCPSARFR
ncbi:MAG: hypothetical protein VB055_06620 [Oscillospiraceae bacterium]|nr:hypothetical protein [Oscillospiraceae bacterium]